MAKISWAATVRLVHERAQHCCEYCQTCEAVIGQPMHVEHIDPNGGDLADNLCLSCAACNLSKGIATTGIDPETSEPTSLFNPRTQQWQAHFRWMENGEIVEGLTATGRATIARLHLNVDRIVLARRVWIRAGEHPPKFGA